MEKVASLDPEPGIVNEMYHWCWKKWSAWRKSLSHKLLKYFNFFIEQINITQKSSHVNQFVFYTSTNFVGLSNFQSFKFAK